MLTCMQTLVRLGAYQSLDLTISEALNQRSPDFPGVVICTANDSLSKLLELMRKRRIHRLVVVEGEVSLSSTTTVDAPILYHGYRRKRRKEARKEDYWELLRSAMFSATSLAMSVSASLWAPARQLRLQIRHMRLRPLFLRPRLHRMRRSKEIPF